MKGHPCPNLVRTRALLAARGLTLMDLAQVIGRSPRTIKNVLNGGQHQAPTQQAITDFLGVEMFHGVKPRLARIAVKLKKGTVIVSPTLKAAEVLETLLRSSTERRRRSLILTQSIVINIEDRKPKQASTV